MSLLPYKEILISNFEGFWGAPKMVHASSVFGAPSGTAKGKHTIEVTT